MPLHVHIKGKRKKSEGGNTVHELEQINYMSATPEQGGLCRFRKKSQFALNQEHIKTPSMEALKSREIGNEPPLQSTSTRTLYCRTVNNSVQENRKKL